jgi:membrane protein implicated in regulation of membrane protease activity
MLLQYWLDIPVWFVFCVIALWILKEVALFPLVWQAYDADERRVAISMIGARGVAKQPLAPSGYVRVRGELWFEKSMDLRYVSSLNKIGDTSNYITCHWHV